MRRKNLGLLLSVKGETKNLAFRFPSLLLFFAAFLNQSAKRKTHPVLQPRLGEQPRIEGVGRLGERGLCEGECR